MMPLVKKGKKICTAMDGWQDFLLKNFIEIVPALLIFLHHLGPTEDYIFTYALKFRIYISLDNKNKNKIIY